jgi:aspartate 1-decarboxylase
MILTMLKGKIHRATITQAELNYMAHSIEINIKEPMMNLLSSNEVTGKTELEKYGIMVLKKL